ncbi:MULTISPECIES: hypothetical protein [Streptomyces]|nr:MULTISPECIES: hypothetical protein [Streptomyces]KPC90964.1 hypothetical protein ADL27_33510 [Streptomyces sp. NRRL F-6602]EPD93705.1 hypothetical protein HMPREF1486_03561 [Streptomyces sp. HPH0547]MDI6408469.1 hypothetical protein [Streptomyces albus]UVN54316.1 hypothetical protein NR995_07025 [Streptomyces albus]GHJ25081.1 hypothetical protein TPA0909_66950 [Streptomyces albus]
MTVTDMRQGQCPGCGSGEIHDVERHPQQGGSLLLRLRHRMTLQRFATRLLVCLECGRFQEHLELDEKDRGEIAKGSVRRLS